MMSPGFLFIALFVGLAGSLYGQSTQPKEAFPTYQQIKHPTGEIIDYDHATPQGNAVSRVVKFNLFDYPAGEVVYMINGKSTTDVQAVKKLMNNKDVQIESLSIKEPTKDSKQIIEINYVAK
ncbi:hypothetical protein ACFSUS_06090 [Spirosoma soli]|uniref:Uncharacterized protein n=1 Tax=Spirosoma soli TaxID=1770529 RepID=A0ABW5M0Y1_9BACT